MTFASPLWLLLLAAVPALAWHARRRGRAQAEGVRFSAAGDAAALPAVGWARLGWLPGALRLAALALAVVALARPQQRDASVARSAEGIDIVLALDASTSMQADDFVPNRFEVAKTVAAEFVRGRTSDRVGLVVFAAQAYTQAPLTLDYPFLLAMLREVQMGTIEDGTAIGTAIATATARLRDSEAQSKVLILLTDGQSNRGQVDPETAAEAARALGVRIYAIGVGGDGGLGSGSPSPFGGMLAPPPTQIDETTLRAVAETTGGRYFRATDAEALRSIYSAIGEMETTRIEETVLLDVEELYRLALWPALLCLGAAAVLSGTRLRRVP
ncbi:MAG TPA: VWA domain-containing protein [Rubricoccaceae bacterium]|jgi:Ca-activated chloride channel family protein